jgi:hypothetical protein
VIGAWGWGRENGYELTGIDCVPVPQHLSRSVTTSRCDGHPQWLTLILHEPPMLIPPIPPMPPEALPVGEGIAIPVPVGAIPVIADTVIEADVIAELLWSISMVAG